MQIRLKSNGQVMYLSELQAQMPNVSGPLTALYDPVFEGPQPTLTRYQVAAQQGVVQIGGKWHTNWVAVDMADDAKAALDAQQAAGVRTDRDNRLAATDWRFRSDMNPSQEWKGYCQALRDVPAQAGFPWDVQWPEQP